jgi:hypothetical protein
MAQRSSGTLSLGADVVFILTDPRVGAPETELDCSKLREKATGKLQSRLTDVRTGNGRYVERNVAVVGLLV